MNVQVCKAILGIGVIEGVLVHGCCRDVAFGHFVPSLNVWVAGVVLDGYQGA